MKIFKRAKESKAIKGESLPDYSSREARQEAANLLFERAKRARSAAEQEWTRCNDCYNFIRNAEAETAYICGEKDLPPIRADLPDPYIQVESQIDTSVPEPEFRGRDGDEDSAKAREREWAVRYVCENNRLSDMNTKNERRLIKLGDALWKAYWDGSMRCGASEGDIRVTDVPLEAFYPDPAAAELQDCQYVNHVYRLPRAVFLQKYGAELREMGISMTTLESSYEAREKLFDLTGALDGGDDTVQVLEHWFRQPEDTKYEEALIPAGAVACSIQAGGVELRYIPNFWRRTHRQCSLFPFVHYWRIRDENNFWNKSELFPILNLIEAADRKLASALINDAFMSNDIVLCEENALADGEELTNEPGAVIKLRPNGMGRIARLGGLQSAANSAALINWLGEQMQRATRNFETNLGKETARQTTATGLAMLRSDAEGQSDIKKADRKAGFERLYELIDWLALEFYDDGRLIFIGAKKERAPVSFRYDSALYCRRMPAVNDLLTGETVREAWTYWPRVDVTVASNGGEQISRQATLNALGTLAASPITAENYKLLEAQLEILDLPMKQEIKESWEKRFSGPVP